VAELPQLLHAFRDVSLGFLLPAHPFVKLADIFWVGHPHRSARSRLLAFKDRVEEVARRREGPESPRHIPKRTHR